MKKTLLFILLAFISIAGFSQDIISLKNGEKREAIILETSPAIVRYRLFSEPNGRMYFLFRDEVASIKYKNGKIETFAQPAEQKPEGSTRKIVKDPPTSSPNRSQENTETSNRSITKASAPETNAVKQAENNNQPDKEIYNPPQEKSSKKNSRNSYQDVVYLKSGSVIQGTIIEKIDNKSIKIETADGNVFFYQMSDIERINQDTLEKNNNSISSSKEISNPPQEKKSKKVSSNSSQAVVYLKSGTVVRGTIIEKKDDGSIKIKTANGNVFFYSMNDIDRITQ